MPLSCTRLHPTYVNADYPHASMLPPVQPQTVGARARMTLEHKSLKEKKFFLRCEAGELERDNA